MSDTIWACSPRTKTKLFILNSYLGAWFQILAASGHYTDLIYIDGFSGPGIYSDGEEGSPLIAVRQANILAAQYPNIKIKIFLIDKNKKALEVLETLKEIEQHHSNVEIELVHGEFLDVIDGVINKIELLPKAPTFSFVDPFGFSQSPYEILQKLIRNDSSEIFINLMCGWMGRFADHPDEKIPEQIKKMIGEDDLENLINAPNRIIKFCEIYAKNLKKLGKYVIPFMMKNDKNVPSHALFFCGNKKLGFQKIKEAMWKADPLDGNGFSEFGEKKKNLNPQVGLFDDEPSTHTLSKDLLDKIKLGQTSVERLESWVVEETRFLPTHLKRQLESLLDQRKITFIDPGGSTRKKAKNAWPSRLLISSL